MRARSNACGLAFLIRHGAEEAVDACSKTLVEAWTGLDENVVRASLDDPSIAHDSDFVGKMADNIEVVRDVQIAQTVIDLKVDQQVDDLPARGEIESGEGFIENNETRVEGERSGYCQPLALSTAQLACAASLRFLCEPDLMEQFHRSQSTLFLRHRALNAKRLFNDL